jgi:NAD(P)-dependent dehydrogenase (short-subunit alcohol dehydrogenase family)
VLLLASWVAGEWSHFFFSFFSLHQLLFLLHTLLWSKHSPTAMALASSSWAVWFASFAVVAFAVWSQARLWPILEAVVTGANTGLGLATARQLLRSGATVVMGCRDMRRCNEARNSLVGQVPDVSLAVPMEIDLASLKSTAQFADAVAAKFPALHVLVLNAAVFPDSFGTAKETGLEMAFSVNHVAHFLLATRLLRNFALDAPSKTCTTTAASGERQHQNATSALKVAVVSSSHHFFAVNKPLTEASFQDAASFAMDEAYGYSKLANLLFMQELSKRLLSRGVNVYVNAVQPGESRRPHLIGGYDT